MQSCVGGGPFPNAGAQGAHLSLWDVGVAAGLLLSEMGKGCYGATAAPCLTQAGGQSCPWAWGSSAPLVLKALSLVSVIFSKLS